MTSGDHRNLLESGLGVSNQTLGPHEDCIVCRYHMEDRLCEACQKRAPNVVVHGYGYGVGLVHVDYCAGCAEKYLGYRREVHRGTSGDHHVAGSARPVLVDEEVTTGARGGRRATPVLIFFLGLCLMLVAGRCAAGVLWEDRGFRLEWCDWADHELFGWTGLVCGLTLSEGGRFVLGGTGALEVLIPGRGWVADRGILVADGCDLDIRTAQDTAEPGVVVVTEDFACERRGGRVLMMVRLPLMFKKTSPTAARWAPREVQYNVEKGR